MIRAWVGMPHSIGVTDSHVYTRGCNDSVAERGWLESGVSKESAHSRQSTQIPRQLCLGEFVLSNIEK